MPAPSRKSTGWRSIPPCEFWVCPACLVGSDPDDWQIQHDIVHCGLSPSYQRAVCSLWCPRCAADFGSGSGAAEIARLTESRIEARRHHIPLRQRLIATLLLRRSARSARTASTEAKAGVQGDRG